jgi:CheY-like chemotaxis protein
LSLIPRGGGFRYHGLKADAPQSGPFDVTQENGVMHGQRVLLVEDDPVARTLLGSILEAAGYGVALAANGREALEVLRTGDKPFVILLDLKMPVMSGWEFREEQRRDPEMAGIPVIILSGDGDLDAVATALGAAGHISKPVDPDELLAIVRDLAG